MEFVEDDLQTHLAGRQREVLTLAAMGYTDKQIGSALDISLWTIRTYWDRLRLRLNASSRTQAVAVYAASELADLQRRLLAISTLLPELDGWTAVFIDGECCFAGEWFHHAVRKIHEPLVGLALDKITAHVEDTFAMDRQNRGAFVLLRASPNVSESKPEIDLVQRMLAGLQELAWIALPSGLVAYCNPFWSTYSGLPQSEFEAAGCARLIHPDEVASSTERWRNAKATEEGYSADALYRCDGSYQPHQLKLSPLFDAFGRVACWIGQATPVQSHPT